PQPPLLDLQERSGCARFAQILSLPQGERNTGANAPTVKPGHPVVEPAPPTGPFSPLAGETAGPGAASAATFGPAREGKAARTATPDTKKAGRGPPFAFAVAGAPR